MSNFVDPLVFTTKKPRESDSCVEIVVFVSHGNKLPSCFFTFTPGTHETINEAPAASVAVHATEISCPLEIVEGVTVYDVICGLAACAV